MASVVHLDVNDTSPTILYSPSNSSTSPTSGWTTCFSSGCQPQAGTIPAGTSYHITAHDNASFTLSWQGTGVQLRGNLSDSSHLNYTVYLDGNVTTPDFVDLSQNLLASFQSLPLQRHNLSLVVHSYPSNMGILAFEKATITSPSPMNRTGAYVQVPVNDTSVAWYGRWSFQNDPQLGLIHRSTTAGDKAIAHFQGTAVTLLGSTMATSGLYTISLGPSINGSLTNLDVTRTKFSAQTSFTNPNALLYYASSLDPTTPYFLTVTNEDGADLIIKSNGFLVFEPSFPVPTPSALPNFPPTLGAPLSSGTIAAIVLAGVLFSVIAALLFYYYLFFRPRTRRCRARTDVLTANSPKRGGKTSPAMRSHATKASGRSSYQRRIDRILSMINPSSRQPSLWNSERPPLPTFNKFDTLDINSGVIEGSQFSHLASVDGEDVGTALVREATAIVESGRQQQGGNMSHRLRSMPGIVVDAAPKSSPNATVPVSPVSVSVTQSQRNSGQTSSRPHSKSYSIPISFSLRHIRVHGRLWSSENEISNGSSGPRRSRPSSSIGLRETGATFDRDLGDEGRSINSLSTITFAKTTGPKVNWKGSSSDEVGVKRWSFRARVGRVVRSILSGLGNAAGRWRKPPGPGIVYPFVGVQSSGGPSELRHTVSGGGLLVLDGQPSEGPSQTIYAGKCRGNASPRSHITELETEITPLSYVSRSSVCLLAHENDSKEGINDTRHPYAATDLSFNEQPQSGSEPAALLPLPSAVPVIRQLPIPPQPTHVIASQRQPSHVTDDNAGRIGPIARPIRALPPLPVAPESKTTTQFADSAKLSNVPPRAHKPPPLKLDLRQKHDSALLSPTSVSHIYAGSQRSSRGSSGSSKSSPPATGFLSVNRVSPFRVDFMDMSNGEGSEGSDLDIATRSPGRTRRAGSRPTLPKLSINTGDTSKHATPHPRAMELVRQPPHRSFLDFSNARAREEGIHGEDDRATFGQKRDRKSSFYYSSGNTSLPSPAESHHSYKTYQTYQSEEVSGQSSWPQYRRHASWRGTFGARPEEYIPEETSPSTPAVPPVPAEIATQAPLGITAPLMADTLGPQSDSQPHPPSNVRLPTEIIQRIFVLHALAHGEVYLPFRSTGVPPQQVVSHVCSEWRHIALSTGELWSDVVIAKFDQETLEMAAMWLRRARNMLVTLKLCLLKSNFPDLAQTIQALCQPVRLRRLEMMLSSCQLAELSAIPDDALPYLEETRVVLHAHKYTPHFQLESFVSRVNFLLCASGPCLDLLQFGCLPMTKMRHLDIRCVELTPTQLVSILYQATSLESCHVLWHWEWDGDEPLALRETTALPNMQVMILEFDRQRRSSIVFDAICRHLTFPNLKKLSLRYRGFTSNSLPTIAAKFNFARLEELELHKTGCVAASEVLKYAPLLRRCSFPKIITFDEDAIAGLSTGGLGRQLTSIKTNYTCDARTMLLMVETRQNNAGKADQAISPFQYVDFRILGNVEDYLGKLDALKEMGVGVVINGYPQQRLRRQQISDTDIPDMWSKFVESPY
ncbi:hypothetical protein APHAL10511_006859 [Amanita phalloides]|nr:hypothetical protein APHAL10511_006859 [Amanita phalloides]